MVRVLITIEVDLPTPPRQRARVTQYGNSSLDGSATQPLGSFARCDSPAPTCSGVVTEHEEFVVDPRDVTAPDVVDVIIASVTAAGEPIQVITRRDEVQWYLDEGFLAYPGNFSVFYDGERLVLVG